MVHVYPGEHFIESDEPLPSARSLQDTAKMLVRSRQETIACKLSRLASEEYMGDIMAHMQHMEEETLPDVNLINEQPQIKWFMRASLMDFLTEIHAAFALLPETLFLAVNLLDRYCSRRVVYEIHYPLVGCAALLIAAKYSDKKDRIPKISELAKMCCGAYDTRLFTRMEMHILENLEWTIGHPTISFFSQLMIAEEQDDEEVEHMSAYLCEIALYHREFVSVKPSTMARSSLILARTILGRPEANNDGWDQTKNSVLFTLYRHLDKPSSALARKYSSPFLSDVSRKLADFMEKQTTMTNPPSQASETSSSPNPSHTDNISSAATSPKSCLTSPTPTTHENAYENSRAAPSFVSHYT